MPPLPAPNEYTGVIVRDLIAEEEFLGIFQLLFCTDDSPEYLEPKFFGLAFSGKTTYPQ